jgi:hypothetical protein
MLHVLIQAWNFKELAVRHASCSAALSDMLHLGPHLYSSAVAPTVAPGDRPAEHASVLNFLHASTPPAPENWPAAKVQYQPYVAGKK